VFTGGFMATTVIELRKNSNFVTQSLWNTPQKYCAYVNIYCLVLTVITSEVFQLGLWNMLWAYVEKHACKICIKLCLFVFTNMVTLKKFEVISDKNSVGRCRITYFNCASFPNVANLPMCVILILTIMLIKLYVTGMGFRHINICPWTSNSTGRAELYPMSSIQIYLIHYSTGHEGPEGD
jgi:hypothetical protein